MSERRVRIVVNGADHSFQRELGCNCGRFRNPYFRGNTSVSIFVTNSSKSKDEILWHGLIDVGSGVINNLYDNLAKWGSPRVDRLFLTHWHPDHTLGLNQLCEGLRRTRRAKGVPDEKISVWCRQVTRDRLTLSHPYELSRFIDASAPLERLAPGPLLPTLRDAWLGTDELTIHPMALSHATAMDHSTAGFLVEVRNGRRAALLWDLDEFNDDWMLGSSSAEGKEALQNVDLLFLDCNTWEEHAGTGHVGFQRLRQYADTLKPRETMLIHLSGHEDGEGK